MSTHIDLVVPSLTDDFDYHCMIAFSYKDEDLADQVKSYLEAQGLKVAICKEFTLGCAVVDNIKYATEKSRRAVVLISRHYLSSAWYNYETLLFIHNSQKHDRQYIIPVFIDLDDEEIKKTRLGVYNYEKFSSNEIKLQETLQKIAKSVVARDMPMGVSLPNRDIAQGLVWSYYYGYLKLILPGIRERCERSQWWGANGTPIRDRRMIHKVFIVIPGSGLCHSTLEDCDPNIKHVGKLEPHVAHRAGVQERRYENAIYKITSEDGTVYYAPCEYATPVLAMYEMGQEGLAGLNEHGKRHQIHEFRCMLDQVLSHSDKGANNFKIIFFEDNNNNGKDNVAPQIVEEIKRSLEEEERAIIAQKSFEKLELEENANN